jgi:AraC-like DNA-binding protein
MHQPTAAAGHCPPSRSPSSCSPTGRNPPQGTCAAHPRLARILDCIEKQLCDPALGSEFLLRRFYVSRPTLYRMFRPLGGVARYIRERRLQAAHARLRENPHCTITFLLYDLGFESERQFQRAFHMRFGMSPACWREACRACPAAHHAQPARRRLPDWTAVHAGR